MLNPDEDYLYATTPKASGRRTTRLKPASCSRLSAPRETVPDDLLLRSPI